MSTDHDPTRSPESVPRSAVSPSSADLLALKLIVLNLAARMAWFAENTTGVSARDFLNEVADDCHEMLQRHTMTEYPRRDVQKLREEASAAVTEFLESALPAARKDLRGTADQ